MRDIMAAIGTGATGMKGTIAVTEGIMKTAGSAMMAGTLMPEGITGDNG
jgi:hypothetical protein